MAAGAATFRNPPKAQSINSRPTSRLPVNAAMIISGRVVRSIMNSKWAGSEAASDAGGNRLKEHRPSVSEPQSQTPDQEHGADGRRACTCDRASLAPQRRQADVLLGRN